MGSSRRYSRSSCCLPYSMCFWILCAVQTPYGQNFSNQKKCSQLSWEPIEWNKWLWRHVGNPGGICLWPIFFYFFFFLLHTISLRNQDIWCWLPGAFCACSGKKGAWVKQFCLEADVCCGVMWPGATAPWVKSASQRFSLISTPNYC